MDSKSALMLRVLMNRFHQGPPDLFLSSLNKEEADKVLATSVTSSEPIRVILHPLELLGLKIHYSWLLPLMDDFSPEMRSLVISSLPEEIREKVGQMTSTAIVSEISHPGKSYLSKLLCDKLKINSVLPGAFLPMTSLSLLLDQSKDQLIELINLLGIYDLAQEMRQIVDKEVINAIYKALTPTMMSYLKICLHQKDKISVPKIGLKNWRGDASQLRKELHRRGLQRLGGALSGQHPDFLWHISRKLDIGRGNLLLSYYNKKEIPQVTPALIQQVLSTINYLKKMSNQ